MPLPLHIADGGRGILYGFPQGTTAEEVQDLFQRVEANLAGARYILVDVTGLQQPTGGREHVQQFVQRDLRLSRLYPGIAMAIAAPADSVFGMARMYQAMSEEGLWQVGVHRDLESAKAWIRKALGEEGEGLTFA